MGVRDLMPTKTSTFPQLEAIICSSHHGTGPTAAAVEFMKPQSGASKILARVPTHSTGYYVHDRPPQVNNAATLSAGHLLPE